MSSGGYVAVHEDVTAHVDAEERLRHLAGHDQLTGLYNRHAFTEALESALGSARSGNPVAVHCLDLDRFKAVNDGLGHQAGDALLRQVAERIARCAAPRDVVGRLGGDEFIILQHAVEQTACVEALGRKVVGAMARPFNVSSQRITIGVSVGIAMHPSHGATPGLLLRNADRALYEAKSEGGNAFRIAGRPDAAGRDIRPASRRRETWSKSASPAI